MNLKESDSSLHGYKKYDEQDQPPNINPYLDNFPYEPKIPEFK